MVLLVIVVSSSLLVLLNSHSPSTRPPSTRTMFVVDAWKVCDDDGVDDDDNGGEHHKRKSDSSSSSSSRTRGICPDHATCCPTTTTTTATTTPKTTEWGCISSKAHDPTDGSGGTCCDLQTGCSYGYDCAVTLKTMEMTSSPSTLSRHTTNGNDEDEDDQQQDHHHNLHGLICQQNDKIDPNVTPVSAKQTPRPKLCHISNPDVVQVLQKFPIRHRMDNRSNNRGRNDDQQQQQQQQPQQTQQAQAKFHATYYSSIGSILHQHGDDDTKDHNGDPSNNDDDSFFESVIIVIHGSARNADDYLCMGLSLQPTTSHLSTSNSNNNNNDITNSMNAGGGRGRVLVVAPKFPSVNDDDVYPDDPTILRWDELPPNGDKSKTHTWRWGADAVNNTTTSSSKSPSTPEDVIRSSGISSYDVIDQLIEYIVDTYKTIKRVAVIGHSAGGQVVQRWSLLSSSHVWDLATATTTKPSIVAIPANPRSYCYLDGRRMIPVPAKYSADDDKDERNIRKTFVAETRWKFDYPIPADVSKCPTYNHWQWGLDDQTSDNELPCPYKDHALNITGGSTEQMARRYAGRNVVYLTGSEDVEYLDDHCETMNFQGFNRHARAHRFWESIQNYFHDLVDHGDNTVILKHEIHTVEGSPHDHTLMFQSAVSLNTIFGNTPNHVWDDHVYDSDNEEGMTTTTVV